MHVKSWVASIVNSFWIRPNRAKRRWLKKKYARRIAVAGLAIAASTSLNSNTAVGQCDGALFPGQINMTGRDSISATTGDFNGDGLTDLVTANSYDDDVSVLLGFVPKHLYR